MGARWRCAVRDRDAPVRSCVLELGHGGKHRYSAGHGAGRGWKLRTIYVTQDDNQTLVAAAKSSGTSVSAVVRKLIKQAM